MNRVLVRPLSACAALAILSSAPSSAELNTRTIAARPLRTKSCEGAGDLRLVNGKIHTMDARGSVVSSVNIKHGRFAAVGDRGDRSSTPCTIVVDLHGRTVVPGLIDNHIHIIAWGRRPDNDTPLDTAASIAEFQRLIRDRARDVPRGEFISTFGGWSPQQLAERRLPTVAELDAATSDHPIFLAMAGGRRAIANSAGQAFFKARGVAFNADGEIASGADILRAFSILVNATTFDQLKHNTERAMSLAAGYGLTTVMDMGSAMPTAAGAGAGDTDGLGPTTEYGPLMVLAREGKVTIRYRLNYLSRDSKIDLPTLKAGMSGFFRPASDDTIKTVCVGESIIWPLEGPDGFDFHPNELPPGYADAIRTIAGLGHCYEQHSIGLESNRRLTDAWEQVNRVTPLKELRWRIAHALYIDRATVDRLKAMGAGLSLQMKAPYRMIVDSGIHAGAGSDGRTSYPGDPWVHLQYMVTGRDSAGTMLADRPASGIWTPGDIAAGDNSTQTLTRTEALRLYTAANGWFSKEENVLGSIEIGKFGDVAVLDRDYFDARAVPDGAIGRLRSVLTVVGGRKVYESGMSER